MPIGSALTMFDFIDLDESRPLRSADSGVLLTELGQNIAVCFTVSL